MSLFRAYVKLHSLRSPVHQFYERVTQAGYWWRATKWLRRADRGSCRFFATESGGVQIAYRGRLHSEVQLNQALCKIPAGSLSVRLCDASTMHTRTLPPYLPWCRNWTRVEPVQGDWDGMLEAFFGDECEWVPLGQRWEYRRTLVAHALDGGWATMWTKRGKLQLRSGWKTRRMRAWETIACNLSPERALRVATRPVPHPHLSELHVVKPRGRSWMQAYDAWCPHRMYSEMRALRRDWRRVQPILRAADNQDLEILQDGAGFTFTQEPGEEPYRHRRLEELLSARVVRVELAAFVEADPGDHVPRDALPAPPQAICERHGHAGHEGVAAVNGFEAEPGVPWMVREGEDS